MQIAVLTFGRFDEIDSFVVANLLNRMSAKGWRAYITAAEDHVVSRNDVVVEAERKLEFTAEADAYVAHALTVVRPFVAENANAA